MLITAVCAVAYLNTNTAYVQIPALRDTLTEKHVTKMLKCFTISAAPVYIHLYGPSSEMILQYLFLQLHIS